MNWIDALILGIVQGLAEYLPISSSGHLEIFRQILGIDLQGSDALEFDLILHAATVCSTIVVLWPLFRRLCTSFFTFRRDADFYYVCKILVSCIPIAIVGFCFKDTVEEFFGNGLLTVGICLCITALLLAFAHFTDFDFATRRMKATDKGHDITWLDSLIIGCAQAVAVLPGLSRSGCTIATGILLGDKRSAMAQFSFLMVIIPILGEAMLDLKHILKPAADAAQTVAVGAVPMIVGFLASFIVGCLACKWMISIVRRGRMLWFALYCIIIGLLCIFW